MRRGPCRRCAQCVVLLVAGCSDAASALLATGLRWRRGLGRDIDCTWLCKLRCCCGKRSSVRGDIAVPGGEDVAAAGGVSGAAGCRVGAVAGAIASGDMGVGIAWAVTAPVVSAPPSANESSMGLMFGMASKSSAGALPSPGGIWART